MKSYLVLICLLLLSFVTWGQSKKDSVAIRELLEKEASTWREGNIKAHADCWAIKPYSRILISTKEGKSIDLDPKIIVNPPANLMGNGGHAIISNVKMSIIGNSAWVNHDEESVSKDGQSSFSYEMRLLEKINGAWKLVGQSVHSYK